MSNPSGVLVFGSGEGNPGISSVWRYAVIDAVLCFVGFFVLAIIFQDTSQATDFSRMPVRYETKSFGGVSYAMVALGVASIVVAFVIGNVVAKRIKGTNVDVYEDHVEGTAVDKDFAPAKLILMFMGWDKARLANFNLAINQITSVDLGQDNAIIINAPGANYKCFVSNGPEIQTAINNKIRGA